MENTLSLVLILLATAVLVVVLCRILHLPVMLGYLVVGILIGPHALAWMPDAAGTQHLAEFGGVFLMFGVLVPKSLTPVYLLWMPVAQKIAAFNTQVILFLAFWLVFGPVAILRKLTGADDLRLKDVPLDSYFIPKKQVPVTIETCRRQF